MNVISDIFESDENDSFPKKVVQVGLGLGIITLGYFGLSALIRSQWGNIAESKTLKQANQGDEAASLALRLSTAISPSWFGNTDEAEVFKILAYEITGKSQYAKVKQAYFGITNRYLERDLQESLDPAWMPRTDWARAQKYIQQINQRP